MLLKYLGDAATATVGNASPPLLERRVRDQGSPAPAGSVQQAGNRVGPDGTGGECPAIGSWWWIHQGVTGRSVHALRRGKEQVGAMDSGQVRAR